MRAPGKYFLTVCALIPVFALQSSARAGDVTLTQAFQAYRQYFESESLKGKNASHIDTNKNNLGEQAVALAAPLVQAELKAFAEANELPDLLASGRLKLRVTKANWLREPASYLLWLQQRYPLQFEVPCRITKPEGMCRAAQRVTSILSQASFTDEDIEALEQQMSLMKYGQQDFGSFLNPKLEIFIEDSSGQEHLLDSVPVLFASGKLGPKTAQGDRQVPEGLYELDLAKTHSDYFASVHVGYPEELTGLLEQYYPNGGDRGGDIMIHGGNGSAGCLSMGNYEAAWITALVSRYLPPAKAVRPRIEILPFPMTDADFQQIASSRNLPFWHALRKFDEGTYLPRVVPGKTLDDVLDEAGLDRSEFLGDQAP